MQSAIKNFLEENRELIQNPTKDNLEKLIDRAARYDSPLKDIVGQMTDILEEVAQIDVVSIFGYIPSCYKRGSLRSSYIIPSDASSIQNYAISNCPNLTSISIPSSIKRVSSGAFSNCKKLISIEIDEGVSLIDMFAFSDCPALKEVKFPHSVSTLKYGLFEGCDVLENVEIPIEVQEIEENVFSFCLELKSLDYKGTKAQWGKIKKHPKWKANSSIEFVHCLDGDISYVKKSSSKSFADKLVDFVGSEEGEIEFLITKYKQLLEGDSIQKLTSVDPVDLLPLMRILADAGIDPFDELPDLSDLETVYGTDPYEYVFGDDTSKIVSGLFLGMTKSMPSDQLKALLEVCKICGVRVYKLNVNESKCKPANDEYSPYILFPYTKSVSTSPYGPIAVEDLVSIGWTDDPNDLSFFADYTDVAIINPKPEDVGFDSSSVGPDWEKVGGKDRDAVVDYIWDNALGHLYNKV